MPWRDFGSPGKLERVERDALSDPIAEKAYRKLRANGLSSVGQFWELVNMVVALHLEPADRDPGWWRSPKILAGLPRNFKATAGKIERLNRDPRFSLDRQFMEVPAILRKLAKWVDDRRQFLYENRKGRARPKAQILDCLRWLVRQETGRERHADLGKILTEATFARINRHRPADLHKRNLSGDPQFNFEAALKIRRHRERKSLQARKEKPSSNPRH
jgi:hypothetical protein